MLRDGPGQHAGGPAPVDALKQSLAALAYRANGVSPKVVGMPAKTEPAIDDVEPLADSTARQARRVVAAYATDADECRVFLSMLGIGPSKPEA